jgi:hypothetical protein
MDGDLTDIELAALLSALEHVLSHRGVNVCASGWGKQLGDGLFEFRVRRLNSDSVTIEFHEERQRRRLERVDGRDLSDSTSPRCSPFRAGRR